MSEISSMNAILDHKDCTLSNNTLELYNNAAVQSTNEGIAVLFHAFMLESGFMPKDVTLDDKYRCMPKDWNAKGIFKIKYEHSCCSSYTCFMTCVPLYTNMCVHGIICDVDCSESINIRVDVKKYLKESRDVSNIQDTFSNLDKLSRYFKDNFCLPLLNLLHETIGINRLFGLKGLLDEIKVHIMQYLPVESVVSISAVNKNFNYLANLPFLWKYLFKRDFAKVLEEGVSGLDLPTLDTNWKEIYIKEYKLKKRKRLLLHRMPRFPPRIFNLEPDFESEIDWYCGIGTAYPHFDDFPMIPTFPRFRR